MFRALRSSAVPTERRGAGVREDREGRSQAAVESKQMALVLLSAWPSGVYFTDDFIIKQQPHQPTVALSAHVHTLTGCKSSQAQCVKVRRLRGVCLRVYVSASLWRTPLCKHECVYKYACKNVISLSL